MKKGFLVAVVLLCMVVVGCGKEKGEKEDTKLQETETESVVMSEADMIARAEDTLTIIQLQNAYYDNKVAVVQKYSETPVIVTGEIMEIEMDHVEICESQVFLDAFLPADVLASLKTGDSIKVVGFISDAQDIQKNYSGFNYTFPHCIMKECYLIK